MDRYDSKKCLALEDAIDAFGVPSHVELVNGILKITILGTTQVSSGPGNCGTCITIPIEG